MHVVDPSDMFLHLKQIIRFYRYRETPNFPVPRAFIWSMVLEAGTRRVTSPCLSMIQAGQPS